MNTKRSNKRLTLPCLATLLALLTSAQAAERPHIILLMGDDHGWEETGYNGHAHLRTPVLDEMAATGLRLDRFYAAHPNCSPTRRSVLTGRHPIRYGTFSPNWSMRPEEITIAHLLGKAGYATAHFGKWHLGPVKAASPTSPGAMGFDEWLSHDNFFELNPSLSRNGGPPLRFEGESSEIIIEETIRFIGKSQQSGKPFLAVVWFGSPHEPYSGLEKDLALYDNLPEKYAKTTVSLTSNETGGPVRRPLRDVLRERYAEITAMDRAIGTLRNYLKNEGLRKTPCSGIPATTAPRPTPSPRRHCEDRKGPCMRAGSACPASSNGRHAFPNRAQAGSPPISSAVSSAPAPDPLLTARLFVPHVVEVSS